MNHQHQSLFDEKLTFDKLAQYQQTRQNSDDATSAKTSSTYAEMVEEVERASEILIQTQSKLVHAQEEARIYEEEARIATDEVERLEERLQNQDGELVRLHGENSLLLDEGQDLRDTIQELEAEIQERDAGRARPMLEKRLRKAVELLKKDLETSKENLKNSETELISQQGLVLKLEASNKNLQESVVRMVKEEKEAQEKLETCQSQLRQATEESSKMVEEVAEVREELNRTKKIAEEMDVMLRKEIEGKVKEKIRLEVRETVTKQVTERVTRQVKASMKLEHEKQINALRDQFKKVFKENEQLTQKLTESKAAVDRTKKLEDVIPNLKYEISRLLSLLDTVKKDHELAVSELETCFNKKLQKFKEDAAQEKWAHATEMRKSLSKERDREANEYAQRIDALSKQTDRMLQHAEKEKEKYANSVRIRAIEEKEQEISALKEQLATRTRDSDKLMLDVARDKEAYAQQIREQLQEEKRRDLNKHTYKIEVLTSEKENLQKRINSYEEELEWAWKEHDEKSDQLKESQADSKILEDDIFKLKRKNQNLNTLVERYKQDYEEVAAEHNQAKAKFKEILLLSEQRSHTVKGELKQAESMLNQIRNLSKDDDRLLIPMELQQTNSELAVENTKLREKVDNLTSLIHTLRRESLEIEMIRLKDDTVHSSEEQRSTTGGKAQTIQGMKEENVALKRRINEMILLFEASKAKNEQLLRESQNCHSALKASREEVNHLKQQLDDTTSLLQNYKCENADAAKDLERTLRGFEDALTVASEDDNTAQLNSEIQTLERLLDRYKTSNTDVQTENRVQTEETTTAMQDRDIDPKGEGESNKDRHDSVECNSCVALQKKIVDLTYLLDKSCNDLATEQDWKDRLEKEVSVMTKNYASAKDQADKLRVELEEFMEKHAREHNRANQLDSQLQEFLSKEREETERADRLETELQALIAKHSEAQHRADNLKAEMHEYIAANEEGRKKVEHSKAEFQEIKFRHSLTQTRIEELETELQKHQIKRVGTKNATKELSGELNKLKAEHSDISKQLRTSKTELRKSEQEKVDLQRKLSDMTLLVTHGQDESDEAATDISLEEKQRAMDIRRSTNRKDELGKELQKLKAEHNDVSIGLNHSKRLFKDKIMKAEQEKCNLQNEIEEMNALAEKNRDEFTKSREELIEAKRQLELALVKAETQSGQKALELEETLKKAHSENEQLREKAKDLGQELLNLKRQLQDPSAEESEDVREKAKNLQMLLEVTRRDHERTKEDLEHSIQLFKEALAAWRDESKTLHEELRTLRQSSSHSTSIHLGESSDSRDIEGSKSLIKQKTVSLPMATAVNINIAATDEKPKECFGTASLSDAIFGNARDNDYTSSSESSHTSLVNKWRQETHKLIEEVEAAHKQRRDDNITEDAGKADKTGNSISSHGTAASRSSRSLLKAISSHTDLASVDSDEEMLREKFGIQLEEWNKTLDDFSSSILNVKEKASTTYSIAQNQSTKEDSASRSERSILRSTAQSSISATRKTVTWNNIVEELSFESEDDTLAPSESMSEGQQTNASFTFQHDFENEAKALYEKEEEQDEVPFSDENDDFIERNKLESTNSVLIPTLNEGGDVDACATSEELLPPNEVDYSVSRSSHTGKDGVVRHYDDDSTLDWQLQSSGGSSSASQRLETSGGNHRTEESQISGLNNEKTISSSGEEDQDEMHLHTDLATPDQDISTAPTPDPAENELPVYGKHSHISECLRPKSSSFSRNSYTRSARTEKPDQGVGDDRVVQGGSSSSSHSSRADQSLVTVELTSISKSSSASSDSTTGKMNEENADARKEHRNLIISSHSARGLTPEKIAEKVIPMIKLNMNNSEGEAKSTIVAGNTNTNKFFMSSSSSSDSEIAHRRGQTALTFPGDAMLNKILPSSSSSSYSGRAHRNMPPLPPAGDPESRNDNPSGMKDLLGKGFTRAPISSSSSSSFSGTSSPCPSSFSTSFSGSDSSHSNRRRHVDMTGEVKESLPPILPTALQPIGEETGDDANKSGDKSAPEKIARGKLSKTGLRRFIRKKRGTKKKGHKSKTSANESSSTFDIVPLSTLAEAETRDDPE